MASKYSDVNWEKGWDMNCSLESLQQISDACIHCGQCKAHCDFLSKYDMDLGNVDMLRQHTYSCFLCGECDRVCPMGIRGSHLFLQLRRMQVRDNGLEEKPYSFVLNEKRNYRFRNYRKATAGSVLFPGCNFPSMFPKTNQRIAELCREKGIGLVYDCCGKPIAELGLYKDEQRILKELAERLSEGHISEIITMCPNCYGFLKGRIPQKVTSVYEVLPELVSEIQVTKDVEIQIPCPDRGDLEWYGKISELLGYEPKVTQAKQCCGLGGMASAKEPELAKSFGTGLDEGIHNTTFCASCAGQFARNGKEIRHILSLMLGVDEAPATRTSYLNRVRTKFK
ncbi:MAG: (Fe-S)-binding protein [Eubacteriales bacterium]|nr:(Fe-S)-binding protein [Eubacteriales bacterium]